MSVRIAYIAKRISLLTGVVLVISLLYNGVNPNGIRLLTPYRIIRVGDDRQKVPLFQTRSAFSEVAVETEPLDEITLADFEQVVLSGEALVFDTRPREDYCKGHIPGAFSVPYAELLAGRVELGEIEPTRRIITYCEGRSCQESIDLAVHLSQLGYLAVSFYLGGWEEWQQEGKSIVRGCQP